MKILPRLGPDVRTLRRGISAKLTVMAAVAIAAFLLLSVTESLAVRSVVKQVESEDLQRRVERVQRFFARRAEAKANLVSEFAFWDDTWDMMERPSISSSRAHFERNFLEWLPQRYGDAVVEVWNNRREPVWRWRDSVRAGTGPVFDRERLFNRLQQRRLMGGYVQGSTGLMLVGSGVILQAGDPTLQGPANGFLVVAEPIDSVRIARYADELQESLVLAPLPAGWPSDSIARRVEGDSLRTSFAMVGLDGTPVALVSIHSSRTLGQRLGTWTTLLPVSVMGLGVLVLVLLWRAGNRLVVTPLNQVGDELDRMQAQGHLSRITAPMPTGEWNVFVSGFNTTIDALQDSERMYRVLFDQAVDAHFLLDQSNGTILEANPAAVQMAGTTRERLIGQAFAAVIPLEPAGGEDTFRFRRPDGSGVTVGVARAEFEIGGRPRQLASLRDLTRSEALAAQLRQAQKMEAIGSLAGGVAHDFNNLLGAVLVATSTLREELAGHAGSAESLRTIDQASRRAAELTRQLLSFARREQQQTVSVAVADVVANVVRLCQRTFDRAIIIEHYVAPGLPTVAGDAGQLEQVLLNLCINARDAMPGGGVLRIRAALDRVPPGSPGLDLPAGDYLTLTVTDTGTGFSEEAEKHLFEPFFTTKGAGKGTGLGLAIVYGLVRAHGGVTRARNAPGAGAEFTVYLPPEAVARRPEPGAAPAPLPQGRERILVIDDEPAIRSAVRRGLARLGYQVDTAESGDEGVRLVSEAPEKFDLVLLDMLMPGSGGLATFRKLRRLRPAIAVVICSGYSEDEERAELAREGAEGFLPKPFELAGLAVLVRRVLDGQAAGGQVDGGRRPA